MRLVIALLVTTLMLFSGAAAWADTQYDWSGFSIAGGGGAGAWNADETTVSPTTGACDECIPMTQGGVGGFGTVRGGYDFQTGRFVFGPFGDIDFGGISGTIQDGGPFFSGRTRQDLSFAVGARAGWLVTPTFLPYATAGFVDSHFSGANMKSSFDGTGNGFSTPDTWRPGWFIGAGAEMALAPQWSLRGEYRYASLASTTLRDTAGGAVAEDSITFAPIEQTFRIEVAYKFGGPSGTPPSAAFTDPGPYNWGGFYVMGGGGYGLVTADTATQNTSGTCHLCSPQTQGGNGGFGRAGLGFDYRATDRIVVGAFGDGSFGNMSVALQDQEPINGGNVQQDWSWAVGARAGWLVTPRVLPFLSAGFTEAHFGSGTLLFENPTFGTGPFSTSSFTANGWFAGAGADVAIAPGWAVRGEYRYASYDSSTVPETQTGTRVGNFVVSPSIQTFALSLVYKFGGFGP